MPIPPSHCVSCRHIMRAGEWKSTEIFFMTVAPVVVKPLMLSKKAFTGMATVPRPASTYGTAPTTAARSHVRATRRNPSRVPSSGLGSVRSRAHPPASVMPTVAAKMPRSCPSTRAMRRGTTRGTESHFTIVPARLVVLRQSVIDESSTGASERRTTDRGHAPHSGDGPRSGLERRRRPVLAWGPGGTAERVLRACRRWLRRAPRGR